MDELRDLLEIAQFMLDRYGADAASVMIERAALHERDGEPEMAEFWARVARAIQGLPANGPAPPGRPVGPTLHDIAFRNAPHPYLLIGPDLAIIDANEAFLAATTTSREEIVGRKFSAVFLDCCGLAGPDMGCLLEASLTRALESGRPDRMPPLRLAVRRPDGEMEMRWWRPLNAPVLGNDGRLALVIQSVEDVTHQARRGDEGDEPEPQ